MEVNDSDIETQGEHSAALRTDRGGGTLAVNVGTYVSHGSEAVVVEGKNSVALKDCVVSGNMSMGNGENLHNVMVYQSMSGDADAGTSSFSMEGGSLGSGTGDMFYVTNTSCAIVLKGVALKLSNDCLLRVVGNSEGDAGTVSLSIDGTSSFELSSDTHVSSFSGSLDMVKTNGHVFYVGGKAVKK